MAHHVSLTPELAAFLASKVNTGHHRSASEVVRATPWLLDEQDRRADCQTSEGTRNAR
jgi:antitoxin ParD1/3/4